MSSSDSGIVSRLGSENIAKSQEDHGRSAFEKYATSYDIKKLEEAIVYGRKSLDFRPIGCKFRDISLYNLALYLYKHYECLGSMKELQECITHGLEALGLRPIDHSRRSSTLNILGLAFWSQYKQLGQQVDLDNAINYHQEALDLRPIGHPDRSHSLNNLAIVLQSRYKQFGQQVDLGNAINYHQEALDLCPIGHPNRSHSLNNLAFVLQSRYKQFGQQVDLGNAINHHQQALDLRPIGHPDRSSTLNNLASALQSRYEQLRQQVDLDNAINHYQQALDLHPIGHPDRSCSLNNLANALQSRYKQFGQQVDLDNAINHHQQALDLRPIGHPDRSMSLNNFATALWLRYKQFGQQVDLDNVINYSQQALDLLPIGHPIRSLFLTNLAVVYLSISDGLFPLSTVEYAFNLFVAAAGHRSAPMHEQLRVALQWCSYAQTYNHVSVLSAYSCVLRLLDQCLTIYPDIGQQHNFLTSQSRSLACDAAAYAIIRGDLEKAVEFLEQGRTILWSRMLGYRQSFDQLHDIDPELAKEFEETCAQLENNAVMTGSSQTAHILDNQIQRHQILLEKWDGLIAKIRLHDDFHNFLMPIPFETLQSVASKFPVIIINISHIQSDALILHSSSTPIVVALPLTTPQNLSKLSSKLTNAVKSDDIDRQKEITPLLRDLWSLLVDPIVAQLESLQIPHMTRIWWCLTAESHGLPIHAAGPYRARERNLPDLYISSYTPTLSALMRAEASTVHPPSVLKLFVFCQPTATLPKAQAEFDQVKSLGGYIESLNSEKSTRDMILSRLQENSWAHFICHGCQDRDPFQSFLQLNDQKDAGHLTILEIMKAKLPKAEFAFLSACHTAAADKEGVPDEVIHITSALQFAGFKSVIGTLWQAPDHEGPELAMEFYKYMFQRGNGTTDYQDAATALNVATRALQEKKVPVDRWIQYVHVGA
ncbi:hypothetical protein JAAARDRAFT_172223 [Jaapia argillacea MUCL 33604]|uniref:CHAT domain-containing protein n=1 Tax=Jaapia argillacea MUCL 33604 TaxID=933084 RepID=A0A067QE46_9AGAM|nr:hypothetical protein JAAARDRAFT_172223 [Jaapia argillacea MUCL 33604]